MATDTTLAGLDALELAPEPGRRGAAERAARVWAATWPKLAAIALVWVIWEAVHLTGWKKYVLPGPGVTLSNLWDQAQTSLLWHAVGDTLLRAVIGYALAVVVGTVVGLLVARIPPVRAAVGSLITGLQTIPSVVWIPFAIILFGNNSTAILFMVVITASPAIANGLITGVDFTPPLLLRAGKTMGLRRFELYRSLILPAALPSFVAGLKQGWAFAWHGLLAGELLVIVPNLASIGVLLVSDQDQTDMVGVISIMIVILILGVLVDVLFNTLNESLRRRRGLAQTPSTAKGWRLATGVAR